jgi:hypothetical protein
MSRAVLISGVVFSGLALSLAACSPSSEPGPAPVLAGAGGSAGSAGSAAAGGAQSGAPNAQSGAPNQADDWSSLPPVTNPDPELMKLGARRDTYDRVCKRARGDSFAKVLCANGRPQIRSLTHLLELVGLHENRAFAMTGNSTSLVARQVNSINPRIIVFPRVEEDLARPATLTVVGFVRGEQFVELVSRDSTSGDLNFYLLSFEQRCSYTSAGCDLAALLTEEIEHDWTAYSVYDHDDLEATSFDCLSCHRPAGPGTKRILRMQELESPWLHWFPQRFVQRTESDRVLLPQFSEAHKHDEQYGGISIAALTTTLGEGSAAQLEALVRAEGFAEQPNPFDARIATEMKNGSSATWEARVGAHLRGEAIAVPYPGVDVTDEAKRSMAIRSYHDVVEARAPRESLLDLREVFSEDAMRKLSFVPAPAAAGSTILLQMCARCHDGRSDPQLGKSRFNVLKLEEMPRAAKDLAISRLTEPGVLRMPPWRVGTLTPESVQAITLELQK